MKKHTKWWLALVAVAVIGGGAWGLQHHQDQQTITVGSLGGDVETWQQIAKSPVTKQAGLKIKVKSFTNPVQLNDATAHGEIDVNAFQSWAYLANYNHEHPKKQLAALGTTYLEPMGLYSDKYHQLKALPDGAQIAIPNNPANTARALALLQSAGLIKLKATFTSTSGTNQIAANPHHFKFLEIDDTTGPRVLKSTDAVVIGNTIAQEGHLNVLKDAIYHEQVNQSTKDNINVLATAKSQAHNKRYLKLVKLYHAKQIQAWVAKRFHGTKVEVNKPLSYLEH